CTEKFDWPIFRGVHGQLRHFTDDGSMRHLCNCEFISDVIPQEISMGQPFLPVGGPKFDYEGREGINFCGLLSVFIFMMFWLGSGEDILAEIVMLIPTFIT
ncbi:hypothetical protein ACTXT7_011484, partial [Hymenolepis weldensis]